MRALLALALLAPLTLAQDAPAARTAAPQLAPPSPLPGDALPEGATWATTASGLRWVLLAKGDETKARPGRTDTVSVFYAGYLEDGSKFDARTRAQGPLSFALNQVIPGWTEGLQLMHPGSKVKLHIPWQAGYGETGSPPRIPGRSNLVFDVELVSVTPDPTPPFALPRDEELRATPSGLKYQVLKEGLPDGRKPVASDTVTVQYAGWLLDGTLFDGSYSRKKPASFGLSRVIKGWTEGVQLMQEGAVYKFVIPASLAYGEKGAGGGLIPPSATLVFQIELLKVGT
jgi:peptidylprolyl isomerase